MYNYSKELCSAKRNIMHINVICFFYAIVICLKSYFNFSDANIVSVLMHVLCSFLVCQFLFHMCFMYKCLFHSRFKSS